MHRTSYRSRLAFFGLGVVLLVLTTYIIYAAITTLNAINQANEAAHINDLYDQAHYLIKTEESLEWQYHVQPNPVVRAQYNTTAAQLITTLQQVDQASNLTHSDQIIVEQKRYELAVNRLFNAINSGDTKLAQSIDSTEVDPVYGLMTQQADEDAQANADQVTSSLVALRQVQYLTILSTSIVCAMSILLLVFFWKLLSYQRKLDQSARFQLAQLERAALIDNLTTLGNHRAYQEEVPRALDKARQQNETLVLALIDVDEFKLINDTHGHAQGDRVLSGLGMLLREVSADAAPYRLGGDEFGLVLPRTSLTEATEALEYLCHEAPRRLFGATLSIGIAHSMSEVSKVQELQEKADLALYEAKRRGRNQVTTFEDAQSSTSRIPATKARAMQRLLAEGQVAVAFQPIWDLKRGHLLAFEALTRPSSEYGFSGPQEAFDIAEQLGYAPDLDKVCLRAILTRVAELRPAGLLFINLSPQTLGHDLLAGTALVQAVKNAGLTPERVVLEITERLMAKPDVIVREAKRLRSLGFGLALDDAGAGNAGLEVLSRLPVDYVKIDRAVVANGLTDKAARGVLSGISAIALETSAFVIAEGIENVEMFDFARQLGVQGVQGYLLGRPSEIIPNITSLGGLGQMTPIS
ncbi:MAG TPA: EAL domain-containing protein [Ktedonobacteraceae bacterium]|nr:EAL domain-containing protein [Ktedonobacteraceae bacterium]